MKNDFSLTPETIDKLNYYVYLLKDPANGRVFYVGKGKGSRVYSHLISANFAKIADIKNSEKLRVIKAINKKGLEPSLEILRHGLSEKEAFEVEAACIDLFEGLTNKVKGHRSNSCGRMTVEEVKIKYEAEEVKIDEPAVIIIINKLYYRDMSEKALYEATRKYWRINLEKGKMAKYVFAVYKGIVRAVYEPKFWSRTKSSKLAGRAYFFGEVASKNILDKYLKKSVRNYIKHGSQNPIRYINL